MQIKAHLAEPKSHVKSTLEHALIFNSTAVEIVILDRWGGTIWKKGKSESLVPIQWGGFDLYGSKVPSGSYTCKITYPDNQVVYVPIVFFQK